MSPDIDSLSCICASSALGRGVVITGLIVGCIGETGRIVGCTGVIGLIGGRTGPIGLIGAIGGCIGLTGVIGWIGGRTGAIGCGGIGPIMGGKKHQIFARNTALCASTKP